MNGKKAIFSALFILFSISFVAVALIVIKNVRAASLKHYPLSIPKFSLSDFTSNSLNSNMQTLFVCFMPDCDYCQKEFESLLPIVDSVTNMQFIFVTAEKYDSIVNYVPVRMFENKRNVKFFGNGAEFFKQFGVKTIPTSFYYDEHKQLKGKYEGFQQFTELLNLIQNKE
ncbi:MAG: thioredoxin fold domain-containing protein [Cytophagaceae bacterium]|jgi:thiol-disulfide isomerase/thioredoxin|nr:thioredoxin fold domain-containing protein [Cytophagaceae bacterium]